jgi:hypothetical protein
MADVNMELDARLANLSKEDWFDRLDELAEEHGSFEPLGPRHFAAFIDAGRSLLVTFESHGQITRADPAAEPRGFDFVRRLGWSHLAIVADAESWFRDIGIYRYFDRLVDDGFFEDFDQVLFFGAHAGGYAAAAYSVVAPGARVLALRPQATLDPRVAGWDPRYVEQRRLCFTDRYGYAPDMLDAADRAYVVFDPAQQLDAMHAALFTKPNVTTLRVPYLGSKLDQAFDGMKILAPAIEAAMDGSLSPARFAQLYRARRSHLPYLRALLTQLEADDRKLLAAHLCRAALVDRDRPHFSRKLAELQAQGYLVETKATEPAQ